MATLSDYLADVRRLLRDSNATFWTDADLIVYVNRAVQQRDRDTGMHRSNVQYALTAGQAVYSIATVASTGTLLFGGSTNAFDVGSIILRHGNSRLLLSQQPYSVIAGLFQSTTSIQSRPAGFAKYGANHVVIAPTPNSAYETEWDLLVYANPLASPNDADPLPYPWTDPVPFLAAHFAQYEMQRQDEAEKFRKEYDRRLAEVLATSRSIAIPAPYGGLPWH